MPPGEKRARRRGLLLLKSGQVGVGDELRWESERMRVSSSSYCDLLRKDLSGKSCSRNPPTRKRRATPKW
jgi:hypothetical protein